MIIDVTHAVYLAAFVAARATRPEIVEACSKPEEMPVDARYYLAEDGHSGYGITPDGDVIGVFSTVKGRGDLLVTSAIAAGGVTLDCFDGYLPTLYARHGFRETGRVPNYTPGKPDVVFMARV
ncbi:hypothetical protein M2302_002249 [Micromonospora sp. A200]|uniref:hypothetical protein n=1 Tax=Micromonospora sp. A200 TaxID=2940568 RepID=UPI0024765B8B|nr:hypothetical protein [Micromonospora sp. A200]MDH6462074.1 hypothetical protein [Micromonospora sp. A200]